jgi:HNH endonuclease
MVRVYIKGTVDERFLAKVNRQSNEDCWPWVGSLDAYGYGQLTCCRDGGKRMRKAHRLAYELSYGSVPDGLSVLHTCDNRRCCNPSHLFLGTQTDNMQDRQRKRRHEHGQTHHAHKLTDNDVRRIRVSKADGISTKELITEFGVCRQTIEAIVRREQWTHVD